MTRRRWTRLGLGLLIVGLAWAGWRAVGERNLRRQLDQVERDMKTGRIIAARDLLVRLAAEWPGRAEVEYRLGACEQIRGDRAAAESAWSRVAPGTPFSVQAAAGRATLLINRGRYSPAEAILVSALGESGPGAVQVRQALGRLYRFEVRLDDVLRTLEESWGLVPDPASLLYDHWELTNLAYPVDAIRRVLDSADGDDDRVWLGRANLATQTGRFAEAAEWLAKCEKARPDDVAVWRGRLDLARASQDLDGVRAAIAHLPADRFSHAGALALRAWIAGRRGETEAERRALVALFAEEPGHAKALERLAEIATEAGQIEQAAEYRRLNHEIGRRMERYRRLIEATHRRDDRDELVRLAGELGRRFEAWGWSHLDSSGRPGPFEVKAGPTGQTLAEAVGDSGPIPATGTKSVSDAMAGALPDFTDDAEAANLRFTFDSGRSVLRQLPETMSGGVGLLDYDGDGRLDVYLVQGGPFPRDLTGQPTGDRLYRNRGDGTFEDATATSGIGGFPKGYGHGVAVGDVDNDGRPDLFITRWHAYALYRNRGDGTFDDVTKAFGLDGDRDWPTSAAFADLDADGDLDLYVCHYLKWDADAPRECVDTKAGVNKYCDPRDFESLPDHLFRNDGGRFVDVTSEAGIVDREGRGLGVVAADLDGDGKVDLFVANDMSSNLFFRNLGGLRFEEVGVERGLATNAEGKAQAGMGIACGDLDGDGLIDLVVTNFYDESTTLFQNLGGGIFGDRTATVGLAAASRYSLGFGVAFLDANADGRLDLMTANGHVNDSRPYFPYAMPATLLIGDAAGRLIDVSVRAGAPWRVPRIGRGLATGDLDNDGRIDAVLLPQDEPVAYFHNRTRGGHWIGLRLEGTKSNRDGVGARVTVNAGGRARVGWRFGGGSYQSAGDGRLHFGLGAADRVESVEVRWPSGRTDYFAGLAVDASYRLKEGDPSATPTRP